MADFLEAIQAGVGEEVKEAPQAVAVADAAQVAVVVDAVDAVALKGPMDHLGD